MTEETKLPTVGAIAKLATGEETGLIIIGDLADEGETEALILPKTRECHDHLYDRLVTAFAGKPERYTLADLALSVIGFEVKPAQSRAA